MKRIIFILIFLILVGFGIYKFLLSPKTLYRESRVERRDLEIYLNASGKVKAAQEQKAAFSLVGEVELVASTGAAFKKGEILARLKTGDLWAALQQAYANLNKARSNFYYYLEAKGQADAANGWKEDKVSKSLVSQANNSVSMAQDGVESAQFAVDAARSTYNKAFIKTAFDGVVGQSLIKPGETVSPGQTVLNFINPDAFVFEAEVDEVDVRFLKKGQAAKIQVDSLPGQTFEGSVESIDGTAHTTPSGGTAYFTSVKFSQTNGVNLRSGLNGEVQVLKELKKDSLIVPAPFVLQKEGKSYLLVKNSPSGENETRLVELGDFIDGNYQIIKGVSLGETVLTAIKK